MSAVWKELATVAVALSIVGAAVYGLNDQAVFVPPPDAVIEEFKTKLATGRFAPARSHLAESVAAHVTSDSLRNLMARRDTAHLTLVLSRERGEWKVSELR
jgi:ABC-type nitrate/sulfonate/bicarbonate transport system permease component